MTYKTIFAPKDTQLLRRGAAALAALILTAVTIPGGHAPFALGVLSAAGGGAMGLAAMGGTLAGAVLFMSFARALPHLAAAVLIVTAAAALQSSTFFRDVKKRALIASGMFLAVGGIYVAQSLSPMEDLSACLAGAGLTGISAWMFSAAAAGESRRSADGWVMLLSALLLALRDVDVGGLSLGRGLLCLMVLFLAYDRGMSYGAAAGLAIGLTVDLCCGSGMCTAALGLGGVCAGSQKGRRRLRTALVFLLGVFAALLPSSEQGATALLLEAAAAAGGFLALPGRVFGGKRIQRSAVEEAAGAERWKRRIEGAAQALRDLYDSCGRSGAQSAEENPAIVFDRAAEKVCRDCALCQHCWQKEYSATFNALNDATPFLLERGRGLPKDFPRHFTDRCIHLQEFLGAVNGELSAYLLRRQYRRALEETRRSARGQYAQLSDLLTATAAGMEEAVHAAAQEQPCRIGVALRPKEGESVCGDTVLSFRTESGKWCLLLSDGMGSGEPARKESALTCRLLRQFLEAGIAAEAALQTLNAAMALRGAESGSFTTVDLCVYDPYTAEATLYKYGAAPSYLKRHGSVRRIAGISLPVGLRGTPAPPDITKVTLREGSFLVMLSDGVADPGRDDWLQNLLAGWEGEDPQVLAGLIMRESRRERKGEDDCGVQILFCPEREERAV